MLQLRLLGPFEVRRDDGSAVPLPGRQSMAILACPALTDYFVVARERLAELIWAGRGTEHANGSLRQELVRLRRAIGEEVLPAAGTTSQPVRLDITDIDIDVLRFRAAAATPGGGGEAIALYRGPLLQDFPLRPRDPLGDRIAVHRQQLHDIARTLMLCMLRGGEGSPALAQRLLASIRCARKLIAFSSAIMPGAVTWPVRRAGSMHVQRLLAQREWRPPWKSVS